ncbi:VOC family protein, partial [Streptomyces hundungensis]|uniref:VOC family protein n=1 Tax=Streptomyces hundungensis TaxID=1077946 RepID=UPI0033F0A83A
MAVLRARIGQLVVDCADPERLARFWAGLLGGRPVVRDSSWAYVDPQVRYGTAGRGGGGTWSVGPGQPEWPIRASGD